MKNLLSLLVLLILMTGCAQKQKPLDPNKPVYVTVKTSMGDVTVVLYDDTPLHKDNFIKLCQENTYDGVLFHRIVKDFVVQGGDPKSKEREEGVRYGSYSGGYTVPAEILPHYFNKRGVLLDAKKGDDTNPERASAGTQFCFMQGKVMTDEELNAAEVRINDIRRNWLYHKIKKELIEANASLAEEANAELLETEVSVKLMDTLEDLGPYVIPEDRREVYRTIGGAPHLDGSVTIFGEVVEGLDVVEKMSLVETEGAEHFNWPKEPVWVISTKVFQK
ncbi:peptidylprolyl isomerase [Parabacteroides sp. PF5-6]|uniref:peptidylprolyl isomerase n=1 Tax=Parabacteroides sp. PF5-6 TaxID=1742403 RepID=UPI002405B630|nr:peptidylprolyl isomerase [Parabacteroides sp. PF5-6]MDF9830618.1 cyclophilin family peptidyl-prolyl cis-trans isomerase [Parabacteroides sp. PF5-6]